MFGISAPKDVDVAIIGGGPAGSSAAIYTARADLKTVVIDKGLTSGALGMTGKVENYPGLPGKTGPEIVQAIREQARSFGAEFVQAQVLSVDFSEDEKIIFTSDGDYRARAVILATGSMGRGKRVPGEEDYVGRGVSYCATCDAAFFRDQRVAVVGSSDEALEEGSFAARYASEVLFLVPGDEFKAEPHLVEELKEHDNVKVLYNYRLLGVEGDEEGVSGIKVRGPEGEETLDVKGVFIYLQGNKPVTDFLGEYLGTHIDTTEAGCLVVDENFQTRMPGVYAIGDLLCTEVKQAVIAAGEGAWAAVNIDKWLRGRKKVRPDWK